MKCKKYIKAISKANGAVYVIGEDKFESEVGQWDLVKTNEDMTYKEMKEELTKRGVPFKKNASKETLKDLLKEKVE